MALVAAAGPGANLLMAILWGLALKVGIGLEDTSEWVAVPLQLMGLFGVLINVWLMVLNLFPLLPLDGGRVLTALLPQRWAAGFARLEPYGMVILLGLLLTGILGRLLRPLVIFIASLMPGGFAVIETFFH
jgi:Zn-dependent protease